MFKHTLDNKRYYTLNYFYKKNFNKKVFKVPIDMFVGCPNFKRGSCIYCKSHSKSNITNSINYIDQFNDVVKHLSKKWPNSKYIIYFQSGTNTYKNINEYKKVVNYFLKNKDVLGFSFATRPDAINSEWLNYLKALNKKTFLTVELGLQSSSNKTLKLINRSHSRSDFSNCVKKLKKENIRVVAHIINGLPKEKKKHMLKTIKFLNKLSIDGVKIHALYINKDTPISKMYFEGKIKTLTKKEYIDIVCDQLELLNDDIVIERITGDPIKEDLIAPSWLLKKFVVLNDIDKELLKRNSYQGIRNKNKRIKPSIIL